MGIVERNLAEFELTDLDRCKIEQDASGIIHLHLGCFRLELTRDEFEHVVSVIERGRQELRDTKRDVDPDGGERTVAEAQQSSHQTVLTTDQQEALLNSFDALDDASIPYVVLRGYGDLPEAINGSDVDLLIGADQFTEAMELLGKRFHAAESKLANTLDIVDYAARNPLLGVRTLLETPEAVTAYLRRNLVATSVGGRGYIERTFTSDGLVVHVINHLAYPSPMNGKRIRVAAAVENGLLQRRVEHRGFSTPAPPDELAHLVCRGVFDYSGTFPARYIDRCETLSERVFQDPQSTETFQTLATELFYDAGPLVVELVRNHEFDSLRNRLAAFDEY